MWPICASGEGGIERCERDGRADWARYIQLADAHNEPGVLTTFAAYEYSPALPAAGKHHRNVLFNGSDLPENALSSFDVNNAIDLWRGLEETCTGDFNGDGLVDGSDIGLLLSEWGPCTTPCIADLDEDGDVDGGDLGIFLANWGACS